jgi:hypothetical protein
MIKTVMFAPLSERLPISLGIGFFLFIIVFAHPVFCKNQAVSSEPITGDTVPDE